MKNRIHDDERSVSFGACRKYIAAILAMLCIGFAGCGSNNKTVDESSTVESTVAVSGEVSGVDETSAVTGTVAESTKDQHVIFEGEEDVLTTSDENSISGTKNDSSDPDDPENSGGSDSADKTDESAVTEDAGNTVDESTTEPLIQILPDGGLLLPDDEWE